MPRWSTTRLGLPAARRATRSWIGRTTLGVLFFVALYSLWSGQALLFVGRRSIWPYQPGQYGRFLVKRHRDVAAKQNHRWSSPEQVDLFDLMADRNETLCEGWTPELPKNTIAADILWDQCWRARIWRQIDEFELPQAFKGEKHMEEHNTAALQRLKRCVARPIQYTTPQEHPDYVPLGRRRSTHADVEDTPCSLTATRAVLGIWWYFTCAILDLDTSGEAIWLKSQIQALRELGYTVLLANTYPGFISANRAMPDVISRLWMEDKFAMSCLGDPRCTDWDRFESHDISYPSLATDEDGLTIWPGGKVPDYRGYVDRQKWMWTRDELDRIPTDERGTIPRYKIFAATYWGSSPGPVAHWNIKPVGAFDFNALGTEWTVSPYDYHNHSVFPYSVEENCMATDYVPPDQREDRMMVLAKKTEFFWWFYSAAPTFWQRAKRLTGLGVVSTAKDDPRRPGEEDIELPKGIDALGRKSQAQFSAELARSRVLLGIGQPEMSPSVYDALCLGTPVVLPYHNESQPVPSGWDQFDRNLFQHGPAARIGPPYVYSYLTLDEADMVAKLKMAKENPIGRFVPPEMRWDAVVANMDDYMRFDWARHGQANEQHLLERMTESHVRIYGRCWEVGQCQPLKSHA